MKYLLFVVIFVPVFVAVRRILQWILEKWGGGSE